MRVTARNPSVLARCERDDVIVVWVFGPHRRRLRWVRDDLGTVSQQRDELLGWTLWDTAAKLRTSERPLNLAQEARAEDQLDGAIEPPLDQPRRRTVP